jgi:RHS repeat-associated protein
VTFGYDQDSLLVQAGPLSLTRDSRNGLLTATTLERVATTQTYNGFAEPATFDARVDGAAVLSVRYTRDRLGRIVQKEETAAGTTDSLAYAYDLAGRLTRVEKNGVILSRYEYDGNGNRLLREGPEGITTADYDAQDRLLRYGNTAFAYTANGDLASRTQGGQTVSYDYDELGNLRGVTLADGIRIDYVLDGQSRRIGKKVNGTLVQGFLYKDQLEPVAELNGAGGVVAVFIYGSRPHVPDTMLKGGRTYRIVTDHLGSPRLVIDTGTGEIVQRLDYDEYGKVILDTNPRFQPFGFAGGLYDPQTGLVRFGARDYDPEVGRWTAKDPIGFGGRERQSL